MATLKKVNSDGAELGSFEVSDAVFAAEVNESLVHDVIIGLQSNQRHGTHDTKTRGEIRGGGKKPYRQKGTGNARQGTIRAPQFRGGGTIWGPTPRKYRHNLTPQAKRQALCCVLSARAGEDRLNVLSGFACEAPKTKLFAKLIENVAPGGRKTLLVTADKNNNALLSARNLQRVTIRTAADVNALDVLLANRVVVQEEAIAQLQERLS